MITALWDGGVGSLFLIVFLGLLLGRLRLQRTSLGVAGVLLVALVLGHYGASVPQVVLPLGTVLFVTAVGLSAGSGFRVVLRRFGGFIVLVALATVGSGLGAALLASRLLGLGPGLAAGMLAGGMTSTPGLSAAVEATGGDPLVGVGYTVAYPLGVIGVVGVLNLLARMYPRPRARRATEAYNREAAGRRETRAGGSALPLAGIIALGVAVGQVPLPLPGLGYITLGLAGGPLLVAMGLGHLEKVGSVSLRFAEPSLVLLRDLGAVFILAGVGTAAGERFLELLGGQGLGLLLGGMAVTFVSLSAAAISALAIFRGDLAGAMGAVSGGMTSTPGLAVSLDAIGDEGPALTYAAVYPVAIVLNAIAAKIITQMIV